VRHNIAADPLFVNAAAANFRLSLGSPCLDGGTNLAWTATGADLGGSPRRGPATYITDMGCYERPLFAGSVVIIR
jgi:hypothetical protein